MVENGNVALMRRHWMNKLDIKIGGLNNVEIEINDQVESNKLMKEFVELFREKTGKYRHEKITLKVKKYIHRYFVSQDP